MILNELVKSGPLAKIWLSAHQEKKLSKAQALGVDVGESVEAILTQDDALPLRSSGPLMLGVVRIYSRKVGYLFDDCKEARERISLAFRPGIVDLPEDQVRASKNAITFPDVRNDFDYLDWTWSGPAFALPEAPSGELPAALRDARTREFGAFNFGRPAAPSIYGGSATASRHGSQDLDGSLIDSNDFSGIDLGLNLEGDMTMDVEMGRDVMTPLRDFSLERGDSAFAKRAGSRAESLGLGSIQGDVGGIDLGLDFDNIDQPLPDLEERSRRETSALSTPPPLSPPPQSLTELTPRTAARVAAAPQAAPKVKRPRLVQADEELELADEQRDITSILGEERYIPSDPEVVRLREIVADPAGHFLPTIRIGGENMIFAGPLGLAPELAELFAFPTTVLRRTRAGEVEEAERAAKRPRVEAEAEVEEDVEVARRVVAGSEAPFDFPSGYGMGAGDESFGFQPEDVPYDEPLITPRAERVLPREREPSIAPSRAESIAREIQFGSAGEFPLAMFDPRTGSAREEASQLSQLSTPSKTQTASEKTTVSGFSKNTSMAMGLLRKEIDAIDEDDKVLSFDKLADKSTKRAASSFFFELLVLGTRDCVKLDQPRAYGDISVRGKAKLWPEGEGEGVVESHVGVEA